MHPHDCEKWSRPRRLTYVSGDRQIIDAVKLGLAAQSAVRQLLPAIFRPGAADCCPAAVAATIKKRIAGYLILAP